MARKDGSDVSYAERTKVSAERTRQEIEAALRKYGADQQWSMIDDAKHTAIIGFRLRGRMIRINLKMPDPRKYRSQAQFQQDVRQKWRALLLVIRAKLESINAGVETLEEAFLPHIILPDANTVSEWLGPQLAEAYANGTMPAMLPPPQDTRPQLPPPRRES